MSSIVPFLDADATFDQTDVAAMSSAFDEVTKALRLNHQKSALEMIAIRIIELAHEGERSPTGLRDRLLNDAKSGSGC